MNKDDLLKQLPYSADDFDSIVAEMRQFSDNADKLRAKGESMRVYVTIPDVNTVSATVKSAISEIIINHARNCAYDHEQITRDFLEKHPEAKLSQLADYLCQNCLANADNVAYARILKEASCIMPYGTKNPRQLVQGRKIILRCGWQTWTTPNSYRIGYGDKERLGYFEMFLRIVLFEARAASVRDSVIKDAVSNTVELPYTVNIDALGIMSMKFYKNERLDVEFEDSDKAYRVAAGLFSVRGGELAA